MLLQTVINHKFSQPRKPQLHHSSECSYWTSVTSLSTLQRITFHCPALLSFCLLC